MVATMAGDDASEITSQPSSKSKLRRTIRYRRAFCAAAAAASRASLPSTDRRQRPRTSKRASDMQMVVSPRNAGSAGSGGGINDDDGDNEEETQVASTASFPGNSHGALPVRSPLLRWFRWRQACRRICVASRCHQRRRPRHRRRSDVVDDDDDNNTVGLLLSGARRWGSSWFRRRILGRNEAVTTTAAQTILQMLVLTPLEARIVARTAFLTGLVVFLFQRTATTEQVDGNHHNDDDEGSLVAIAIALFYHLLVDSIRSLVVTVLVMALFLRHRSSSPDNGDRVATIWSWVRYAACLSIPVVVGIVALGGFAVAATTAATLFTRHVWTAHGLQGEDDMAPERNKLPPYARVKALDFARSSSSSSSSSPSPLLLLVGYYTGHVVLWPMNSEDDEVCSSNKNNKADEAIPTSKPRRASSAATAVAVSKRPIRAVKFLFRQFFVAAGDDGKLYVFKYAAVTEDNNKSTEAAYRDTYRIKQIQTVDAHGDFIRSIDFVQDSLLTCSDDLLIKLWTVTDNNDVSLRCSQVFQGHEHYVMQAKFHPDNPSIFASASLDGTIKLWEASTGAEEGDEEDALLIPPPSASASAAIATLQGHENGVNCIEWYCAGPNKTFLVSGSDDHSVKVWSFEVLYWGIVRS